MLVHTATVLTTLPLVTFSLLDHDFTKNEDLVEEGKHKKQSKKDEGDIASPDAALFDTNTGDDYYYDYSDYVEYGDMFENMTTYAEWQSICASPNGTALGSPDVHDDNICVPDNCQDGQDGATWPDCNGRNMLNKDVMLDFGLHIDTDFGRCDDCTRNITLDGEDGYNFMGTDYPTAFLSSNGHISFAQNDDYVPPPDFTTGNYSGTPAFSAFWTDLDVRRGGEITYRQGNDIQDMQHLNDLFNGNYNFQWAFVVTFNRVALYSMWCVDRSVTFQMILAKHDGGTRGIFIYGDLEICPGYNVHPDQQSESWYLASDEEPNRCEGRLGGTGADEYMTGPVGGFNDGNGSVLIVPGSLTYKMCELGQKSGFDLGADVDELNPFLNEDEEASEGLRKKRSTATSGIVSADLTVPFESELEVLATIITTPFDLIKYKFEKLALENGETYADMGKVVAESGCVCRHIHENGLAAEMTIEGVEVENDGANGEVLEDNLVEGACRTLHACHAFVNAQEQVYPYRSFYNTATQDYECINVLNSDKQIQSCVCDRVFQDVVTNHILTSGATAPYGVDSIQHGPNEVCIEPTEPEEPEDDDNTGSSDCSVAWEANCNFDFEDHKCGDRIRFVYGYTQDLNEAIQTVLINDCPGVCGGLADPSCSEYLNVEMADITETINCDSVVADMQAIVVVTKDDRIAKQVLAKRAKLCEKSRHADFKQSAFESVSEMKKAVRLSKNTDSAQKAGVKVQVKAMKDASRALKMAQKATHKADTSQ
jgi:hypothetical protein